MTFLNFTSPGVEACIQLKHFQEALLLCDKGFAVSFKHSTRLYSSLCLNKIWKMGRKDISFWVLHACMHRRKRNQFESNWEISMSL